MKHLAIAGLVAAAAFAAQMASADQPVTNVSAKRHPNIAAAQRLTDKAYEKIVAAQQANEFDMAGHAAKAKDLLDQANTELKAAALAANKH
jgi:hypothetical protein